MIQVNLRPLLSGTAIHQQYSLHSVIADGATVGLHITRSAKHHKKACTTSGSRPILITNPWKDAWTWCRFKVNYLGLIILPLVEMNSMLIAETIPFPLFIMCYKIKKIMGCFKLEEAK